MLRTELDLAAVKEKVKSFVVRKATEAQADGVVIGISGGIDSAVAAYLSVEALGSRRVLGLIMPDLRVTPKEDVDDAKAIGNELSIELKVIDVAPIHRSFMKHLVANRLAEGNLRARIRMAILYYYANSLNRLVVGTGDRSELLLGYFCYDSQTRVLTPEGLKYYWQLQPGSTVFSMDLTSRKLVPAPVQSIHIFDYEGKMIHVGGRHLDLLVTPNHRMLITRNHGKGPLGYTKAEKLLDSPKACLPIPVPWAGETSAPEVIDTSTFLKSSLSTNANRPIRMKTSDFLYLMGLFIGDGTVSHGRVSASVKSDFTREEYSKFKNKRGKFVKLPNPIDRIKTYDSPRVYIASTEGKRSRTPLVQLLDCYGINYSRTPTMVAFSNRALSITLEDCGHGAKNKCIPIWILRLPAQQLVYLYRGLMDSDGSSDGSAYTTTSERLAFQMIELCFKLGMTAWIKWRPPRVSLHNGKEIRSSGVYEIRISQLIESITINRNDFGVVDYKGKIWCPSVPPYENVLVERNGKFVFCGNTKFGDGGVDILPIADLYKTEVRRLGEVLGVNRRIISKRSSPRLWPGQLAESEIGLSYDVIDEILKMRFDQNTDATTISAKLKLPLTDVEKIVSRHDLSVHKRLPPEICKLR